jgi:hypothetical protein
MEEIDDRQDSTSSAKRIRIDDTLPQPPLFEEQCSTNSRKMDSPEGHTLQGRCHCSSTTSGLL